MIQKGGAGEGSGVAVRLAIALIAVAAAIVAVEAALRTHDGVGFAARNFVADRLSPLAAGPASHDPLLGHVPEPGYDATVTPWTTRVSIDAASLRRNAAGQPTPPSVAVVAVGGSETFGEEVADPETWPAHLQTILGQPVANGGVFGYGLDQAVLRAELLVPRLRPWALVVSFVHGDALATEAVQRGGIEKPYFELVDGTLALRNVPVSANRPRIAQIGPIRATLGYSYLADWAARRLGATGWWYAEGAPRVTVHTDAPRVACLLMRRLKDVGEASGARVLVVAHYPPRAFAAPGDSDARAGIGGSARILACADDAGLDTLDTLPVLQERHRANPATFFGQYFTRSHMSAAGNRLVAERVADALAGAPGG